MLALRATTRFDGDDAGSILIILMLESRGVWGKREPSLCRFSPFCFFINYLMRYRFHVAFDSNNFWMYS